MFEVYRSSYRYWLAHYKKINAVNITIDAYVKDAYELSEGSAEARTIASLVSSIDNYKLTRYKASNEATRFRELSATETSLPSGKK